MQKARNLKKIFGAFEDANQTEERQENEYIASLLDRSDHETTDAEILEVLKLLKARLDDAAQKAGLR